MSEKEVVQFVQSLKDSGCNVLNVCHQKQNKNNTHLFEGQDKKTTALRKKILGSLNGYIIIKGEGNPQLKLPSEDTAFMVRQLV